jgi:hypothetical protein
MTAGYSTVYLSFHVRLPKNWPGPGSTSLDQRLVLFAGAAPERPVSLSLYQRQGSDFSPALRVSGLHQPYQGDANPVLPPNLAPATAVKADDWHRWEFVLAAERGGQTNGKIAWWFDGKPMGSYTGLDFWSTTDPAVWRIEWRVLLPSTALQRSLTLMMDELRATGAGSTGEVVAITIAPKLLELAPGASATFTVSGSRLDGGTVAVPVSFSATGGTITSGGTYVAGAATGTFQVNARLLGGTLFDGATVTIAEPVANKDKIEVLNAHPDHWGHRAGRPCS